MKNFTLKGLLTGLTILATATLVAQVKPTGAYSPLGDVQLTKVTDDADNGDGVGDGALLADAQADGQGLGASFTFDGTMEDAVNYNIETNIYNTKGSFSKVRVSLYNKTDGKELAVYEDGGTVLNGKNPEEQVIFSYRSTSDDVGDVLELRFVRNDDGNKVREFKIDNASLNGTFVSKTPVTAVNASGEWMKVGDVTITDVNDDADNGDGPGDGAIQVDNTDQADQGILYTFDDPLVAGQAYEILTNIYPAGNSYVKVEVSLYNKTDDRELVNNGSVTLSDQKNPVEKVNFTYKATADDAGDTFQLKYIRVGDFNPARDFSIDNAYLNGTKLDNSTLSVKDQKLAQGIAIYPNPATSVLNLKQTNTNNSVKNVLLINATGKIIYKKDNLQSIDVSRFSQGLYLLKIETQNGSTLTKKIIVE